MIRHVEQQHISITLFVWRMYKSVVNNCKISVKREKKERH